MENLVFLVEQYNCLSRDINLRDENGDLVYSDKIIQKKQAELNVLKQQISRYEISVNGDITKKAL